MKKWLCLAAALAALAILSRLPHPARDISRLDPVQTVYLYMEGNRLHMETDTGDHGSGKTLPDALSDMKANADAEIFLDTAEYLILDPKVPITQDLFTLLHPTCRVVFTAEKPDLPAAAQYLSIHTPKTTLAHLRAQTP